MYKKIMLGLILLLLLPVGHAVTSQECQNTSYLQINTTKTIEIDGNSSLVESWEEIYCSEGCDYNRRACKPVPTSMPIEIYIFLGVVGFSLIVLSFLKNDVLIMPFLAMLICFALAVVSLDLNKVYCIYEESWRCYTHTYHGIPLATLWLGLGLLMLAYGFIMFLAAGGLSMLPGRR